MEELQVISQLQRDLQAKIDIDNDKRAHRTAYMEISLKIKQFEEKWGKTQDDNEMS